MRAEDNVKVVRRLQAAYAAADIEVIDQLASDDVVFHIPGRLAIRCLAPTLARPRFSATWGRLPL